MSQPTHHQALVVEPGLFRGVRPGQLVKVHPDGGLLVRTPGSAPTSSVAEPGHPPKLIATCTKCRQSLIYARRSINGNRAHLKRHGDHLGDGPTCGSAESEEHQMMKQRIVEAAEWAQRNGAPIADIEEEAYLTKIDRQPDVAIYRASAAGPQPAIAFEYQRSAIRVESLTERTRALNTIFPLVIWLYNEDHELPNAALGRLGFAVDPSNNRYLTIRTSTWRPGDSDAYDIKLGPLIKRAVSVDQIYFEVNGNNALAGRAALIDWESKQLVAKQTELQAAVAGLQTAKFELAEVERSTGRLEETHTALAESQRATVEFKTALEQAHLDRQSIEDRQPHAHSPIS